MVADSTAARVFREDSGGLALERDYTHPASGEQSHDLMGNRPNENQHFMEKGLKGDEAQSLRDDESKAFARHLAEELAVAHAQNLFRELVLFADPRFRGMLRQSLKKNVLDCVSISINKRAVDWKPDRIEEAIAGR